MVEDDKSSLNVVSPHCWGYTNRYLDSLAHLTFPAGSLLLLVGKYPTVSGGRGVLPVSCGLPAMNGWEVSNGIWRPCCIAKVE